MTNSHRLDIQINLVGMINRVLHFLQAAINLVSIGLHAKQNISPQTFSLPDVTSQHIFNSQQWSVERSAKEWERWILRNGFRDVAEGMGGILEEVQSVLAMWEIMLIQKQRQLMGQDWNDVIVRRRQQFHRRTLPQRIEFLQETYGFELDAELVGHITSINAARNCFVHRDGVVSQQDISANGQLIVVWRALVLMLRKGEGEEEIEIKLPYVVEAGEKIIIVAKNRSKNFTLGDPISFTAEEFSQICWTLFVFVSSCVEKLEAYGKKKGFEFISPNETKIQSNLMHK